MGKIFRDLRDLQSVSSRMESIGVPYILCNEQLQQETLAELIDNVEPEQDSLHIGFSVWFNLDIICTTRPKYALVFDIDPLVHAFIYPLLCSTILNSTSREEFASQFLLKIVENDSIAPSKVCLSEGFKMLNRANYGFLAILRAVIICGFCLTRNYANVRIK